MKILEPNLMVLASAGSGKTYQLSNRILGFIAKGVAPETIVALTFTRKAAGEFTDEVLSKIAKACLDKNYAQNIRNDLQIAVNFPDVLEKLIRSLPRITLGTMDGFFSRVVKSFPHELGVSAGNFQLIEGAALKQIHEEMLSGILRDDLTPEQSEKFYQVFRKSLMGREAVNVQRELESYVESWHEQWRNDADRMRWGPIELAEGGSQVQWHEQKNHFEALLMNAMEDIAFNDKRQRPSLEKIITNITNHTVGSGTIGKISSKLADQLLDICSLPIESDIALSLYKDFVMPQATAAIFRDTLLCAARAEMMNACEFTQAIREVIVIYDEVCDRRMRSKGMFNFSDIKVLMNDWANHEEKRLMREALDFRLDAKYSHWLLDEFQDTSRSDWMGLFPLIDEAATDDEGTIFLVGDKKQAIYGWRGGDVRLFDEVHQRYQQNMCVETMPESYRSATEVLSLVNRVCGNVDRLKYFYGAAGYAWQWEDHIAAKKELRGHARVEAIETTEDHNHLTRMVEILHEIGIGKKELSCGILLRTKKDVQTISDHLRAEGFHVIEDGNRKPCEDHPIGVALAQLFRWLADPADRYAEEAVKMSRLHQILLDKFSATYWLKIHHYAAEHGYSGLVNFLLVDQWSQLSAFAKSRVLDIIQKLHEIDTSGTGSAKAASEALARMEISQSPGAAQIQVMTIHKSKGLGFDVVLLPIISKEKIPNSGNFDIARGTDWICQSPPQWARKMIIAMQEAEKTWSEAQCYEAMCVLYVALTRAKQGLYVLLDSKESSEPNNSLTNLIKDSCSGEGTLLFEEGSFACFDRVKTIVKEVSEASPITLGNAIRRHRSKKASHSDNLPKDYAAMQRGTEIHALLEKITWLDDDATNLSALPPVVLAALKNHDIASLLSHGGRSIVCQKEIPVDGMIDGVLVRGIMDRVHIERSNDTIVAVEIIDYKTDVGATANDLLEKHREQLLHYRALTAKALGVSKNMVKCYAIGLHQGVYALIE